MIRLCNFISLKRFNLQFYNSYLKKYNSRKIYLFIKYHWIFRIVSLENDESRRTIFDQQAIYV